ncbi:hypothetical protein D6855_00845 [Butyrivibrio sp. CB08]|uniref:DUF5688 family protein n=1 Tax=Butyrivibrio sp. CB08 TaxID=2364879 RepID=UPI000EA94E26|nr:DUF5688 family protein [Butyrivibrio sp. CB08]RKM61996.1 hypothetical protein D6855_00845 [Butyrivibrio sp. CB08]
MENSIREFTQTLAELVQGRIGKGHTVKDHEVVKNNGVKYNALLIGKEGRCISPTIYIDPFYKAYREGMTMKEIVEEIVKVYNSSMPESDIDVDFFFDFAKVSDKLFFKVVNYEKNRTKLEGVPYRKLMDLAMVPLCRMNSAAIGEGVITITNEHLKSWEITEEELWENIGESAGRVAPLKISSLLDVLERLSGSCIDVPPLCGISVVTNTSDNYGASAVFYPGVLPELAKDRECDLYIVPASVHETLVIPDPQMEMDVDHLIGIIAEVNRTSVAEEEILSDSLYRYDRESGKLFVVKEKAEA